MDNEGKLCWDSKSLSCIPAHRVKNTFSRRPETVENTREADENRGFSLAREGGWFLDREGLGVSCAVSNSSPPTPSQGESCSLSFLHDTQDIRGLDMWISKMLCRLHPVMGLRRKQKLASINCNCKPQAKMTEILNERVHC